MEKLTYEELIQKQDMGTTFYYEETIPFGCRTNEFQINKINDRKDLPKDITFEEAVSLMRKGEVVYFKDILGEWVPFSMQYNFSMKRLLGLQFRTYICPKQIVFVMKKVNPPVSKRDCFQFENDEYNISIYGKRGVIPCSSNNIRVTITEIL